MTCIVAVVNDEGEIFMGADSCGSDDNSWMHVINPKVFTNGPFVFGCSESFRLIDLMTYSFIPPKQDKSITDDHFMRTVFIDSLRDAVKKGGMITDDKPELDGDFLVGYNGKLYSVQSDYAVLTCEEMGMSIGSGTEAARGSLWTTRHHKDARARVKKALDAAEAVVQTVRGPMKIIGPL